MSIPCKMRPAGLESLPLGYTRIEYLQGTGTQYIVTGKEFLPGDGLAVEYQQTTSDFRLEEAVGTRGSGRFLFPPRRNQTGTYQEAYFYTTFNTYLSPWNRVIARMNYKNDGIVTLYGENGTSYSRSLPSVKNINFPALKVFGSSDFKFIGKVWWVEQTRASQIICNLIPVLDPLGVPCMFDKVTRKPFYKSGTGAIIAGMTIKQALNLANLPATGGSLTVSLPLEAAFDAKVQSALNAAADKGWIFTFYWTDVTEYLTPRIDAIVGEGNYTIAFDYTAQKVSLAFELSVTSEQVDEVRTLLESELPDNIVVEIEYYTPLEWLYAASKEYIDTGIIHANDIGMIYEVERTSKSDSYLAGAMDENELFSASPARYVPGLNYRPSWAGMSDFGWGTCPADLPLVKTVGSVNFLNNRKATLENEYVSKEQELETLQTGLNWKNWTLFTLHNPPRSWSGRGRIYWAKFSRGNEMIAHFVPALNQEGQPGMYDTVSKVFKTNSGTGDFLYPGAEQAIQTLDLDLNAKSYAKLTEHGVRRLYHVPKGCNMTKDEYAAVNGFKELIEPPAPLEGYWVPKWRETETQLVCDWIETEPPVDIPAEEV